MKQSSKDAATKVAWITGGFALATTLITVLFTSGSTMKVEPPPPPTTSIIPPTTTSPPPPTTTSPPPSTTSPPPTTVTPTPTSLVPREVVGNWYGGAAGQPANLRITITESADYFVLDVNDVLVESGKVAVKGAVLEIYNNNGIVERFPWSVEKTPRGDLLSIGANLYLRY